MRSRSARAATSAAAALVPVSGGLARGAVRAPAGPGRLARHGGGDEVGLLAAVGRRPPRRERGDHPRRLRRRPGAERHRQPGLVGGEAGEALPLLGPHPDHGQRQGAVVRHRREARGARDVPHRQRRGPRRGRLGRLLRDRPAAAGGHRHRPRHQARAVGPAVLLRRVPGRQAVRRPQQHDRQRGAVRVGAHERQGPEPRARRPQERLQVGRARRQRRRQASDRDGRGSRRRASHRARPRVGRPVVAGRHHHGRPHAVGGRERARHRVDPSPVEPGGEAHQDDLRAVRRVAVPVGVDGPLQRGEHAVGARERAQPPTDGLARDDPVGEQARRPLGRQVRQRRGAEHEARHLGAVRLGRGIRRIGGRVGVAVDEVLAADHREGRPDPPSEPGVRRVDAGVDQRDVSRPPAAGGAAGARLRGRERRGRLRAGGRGLGRREERDRHHGHHLRERRQRLEAPRGQSHADGVHQHPRPERHGRAQAREHRRQGVLALGHRARRRGAALRGGGRRRGVPEQEDRRLGVAGRGQLGRPAGLERVPPPGRGVEGRRAHGGRVGGRRDRNGTRRRRGLGGEGRRCGDDHGGHPERERRAAAAGAAGAHAAIPPGGAVATASMPR